MAQVPGQQRGGRGAVDVVVAEDRDFLVAHGSIRDAPGRDFHLGNRIGIRHQFADGWIEKILDRLEFDIATGQHSRQHLRQLISLRDRQRAGGAAGIEPIAPQLSGRGV